MKRGELTTKEVAMRFDVSPITARLWCRRGLFPNAYEMETPRGAVWMIPEIDIESFEPPKKTGRPPKSKEEKAAGKGKGRSMKK